MEIYERCLSNMELISNRLNSIMSATESRRKNLGEGFEKRQKRTEKSFLLSEFDRKLAEADNAISKLEKRRQRSPNRDLIREDSMIIKDLEEEIELPNPLQEEVRQRVIRDKLTEMKEKGDALAKKLSQKDRCPVCTLKFPCKHSTVSSSKKNSLSAQTSPNMRPRTTGLNFTYDGRRTVQATETKSPEKTTEEFYLDLFQRYFGLKSKEKHESLRRLFAREVESQKQRVKSIEYKKNTIESLRKYREAQIKGLEEEFENVHQEIQMEEVRLIKKETDRLRHISDVKELLSEARARRQQEMQAFAEEQQRLAEEKRKLTEADFATSSRGRSLPSRRPQTPQVILKKKMEDTKRYIDEFINQEINSSYHL
eukprot:TRINITY_DN7650_c0_g1_i8.p1 TRINITY_DN7650_c0_g1~~TRINITY_DN7650_c0_g1_i8.p1  ORF type:complete len:369 (-),score=91.73 TRINITY_DN7650_c0_g1_i8:1495-2601(-)